MATTTNYSWTTPDDTDLVKNGASAIRSLGTAIDTTVFNNAGAAIAKTLIDAKGDLIVGSAADTAARLAAGTNGYLLSANSSATNGLEWVAAPTSGGMTLINSGNTAFSGVQTITFSSIPNTYKHLYVVGMGIRTTNSYGANIQLRFNGDTGNNYRTQRYNIANSTINGEENMNAYTNSCSVSEVNNGSGYNEVIFFEMSLPLYANTTQYKRGQIFSSSRQGTTSFQNQLSPAWNSTSAIDSLTFFTGNSSTGNFTGDGAIYIYGVN